MLSFFDHFLTLWIVHVIFISAIVGYFLPDISNFCNFLSSGTPNISIANGLIVMVHPTLVTVRYENCH
jgi:ACR3 family arsenite efflux pump ArsB